VVALFHGRAKPVRLDDKQVARQVLQRALGRGADKQSLQTIARNRTHDDKVGVDLLGERWQFFMGEAGPQMCAFIVNAVERCHFTKTFLVVLVHLLLNLIERQ
jgi:hypothetical protein